MTRRLRVAVLDLVTKAPNPGLYGRVMNANYAGVIPQIVALWCEQEAKERAAGCYFRPAGALAGGSEPSSPTDARYSTICRTWSSVSSRLEIGGICP